MTRNRLKSGDKLFRVVHALLEMGEAGVTELADELDLPKSSIHQHLKTLEHNAYVVKTDQGYRLGLRFLYVGANIKTQMPVYRASKSQIRNLATKTEAHAGLITEENGRGVLIESSRSIEASDLPFDEFAGIRMTMHATASGKAILAHLDDQPVNKILERHPPVRLTSETITDRATLEAELETVRKRGFSVSSEESIQGLHSVAAPITDLSGQTHGAITVYGPTGTNEEQFVGETSQHVIQASKVCEMNLNHTQME